MNRWLVCSQDFAIGSLTCPRATREHVAESIVIRPSCNDLVGDSDPLQVLLREFIRIDRSQHLPGSGQRSST